jgi:hypothetical protein
MRQTPDKRIAGVESLAHGGAPVSARSIATIDSCRSSTPRSRDDDRHDAYGSATSRRARCSSRRGAGPRVLGSAAACGVSGSRRRSSCASCSTGRVAPAAQLAADSSRNSVPAESNDDDALHAAAEPRAATHQAARRGCEWFEYRLAGGARPRKLEHRTRQVRAPRPCSTPCPFPNPRLAIARRAAERAAHALSERLLRLHRSAVPPPTRSLEAFGCCLRATAALARGSAGCGRGRVVRYLLPAREHIPRARDAVCVGGMIEAVQRGDLDR